MRAGISKINQFVIMSKFSPLSSLLSSAFHITYPHLFPLHASQRISLQICADLNRFFIMSSRRGQGRTIGWCEIKRCPEEAHKCAHTHTHSAGRMQRERLKLRWEQASSTQCPAASVLSIMFTHTYTAWADTCVSERGVEVSISATKHSRHLHKPILHDSEANSLFSFIF